MDKNIEKEAKIFIKRSKKKLINQFASIDEFPLSQNPFTIFMAGSPGAGKTETSKSLVHIFKSLPEPMFVVRIDADEIKKFIPSYNGRNSDQVQGASCLGVEKLYDSILRNSQPAIMDGTLANYSISVKDIIRSVNRGRAVGIFYIYQDPIRAWELTIARGKEEDRYIPKEFFVDAFFQSRENANRIKKELKDKVRLFLIEKDYSDKVAKTKFNINNIDNYIKIDYSRETLLKKIKKLYKM